MTITHHIFDIFICSIKQILSIFLNIKFARHTYYYLDLHMQKESQKIPNIFYGTAWKKGKTAELVEKALRAGFRGIDTACQPKHYNEAGVG